MDSSLILHALNNTKNKINSYDKNDNLKEINIDLKNIYLFLGMQPQSANASLFSEEIQGLTLKIDKLNLDEKKNSMKNKKYEKYKNNEIKSLKISQEEIKYIFQENEKVQESYQYQPQSIKKPKLENNLVSIANQNHNQNLNPANFVPTNHLKQKAIVNQTMNNNETIPVQQTNMSDMFISARDQLKINIKKQGCGNNKYEGYAEENKKGKGTKESKHQENIDDDEDKRNKGNNNTNYKKFQPPYKKESSNQPAKTNLLCRPNSKLKENDEKLKNLDQKMIELIESEILDNSPKISWNDIAGLDAPKSKIIEMIVWPFSNPDIFTGIRAPPRGLLLFGPPGTGKTMIGKAIASDTNFTFFSISASSLTSKWVGEGEKMVKTLFSLALAYQPAVVFIDEVDSLLCSRTENENESSRRIKTEFLCQMEGANTSQTERILLIGATNRPQELDDAALRRFVKKLYIPLPNSKGRKEFIENLITKETERGNYYKVTDTEMDQIVKKTNGYSGADLRNLCAEASLNPIRKVMDISKLTRENLRPTNFEDFLEALTQVKPTVSQKDLKQYMEWNKNYGTVQFSEEELTN